MAPPVVTLRTQRQVMAGWLRLVYPVDMAIRAWEDIRRDELAEMFPGHDIWTVRNSACRHVTWCSRPKGTPTATINTDSADDLQAMIAQELARKYT
jgi:hypothetical protein